MGGGQTTLIKIPKGLLDEVLELETTPPIYPWSPVDLKLIYTHYLTVLNKKKFAKLLHRSYNRVKMMHNSLLEEEAKKGKSLEDIDFINLAETFW